MGVVAILVTCLRPREQTFVPPSHWGSTWNFALIGQAVLEKKIFENGGRRMTDTGRRTDDGPWLYYKLTNDPKGSGELKSYPFLSDISGTILFKILCEKDTLFHIFADFDTLFEWPE